MCVCVCVCVCVTVELLSFPVCVFDLETDDGDEGEETRFICRLIVSVMSP